MEKKIFRMDILAGGADYERLLGLLSLEASFGWEERGLPDGGTVFRLHCENCGFLNDLAAKAGELAPLARIELAEVDAPDWAEAWREFFTPVTCGTRFVVLPPWLADCACGGRVKIVIEPKSAFGTGHHATTALCLEALSGLLDNGALKAGMSFLDLGCGTGVLGIAAAKSGLCGLGLDIDPLAVENAVENHGLNSAVGLTVGLGGIEAAGGRKFDLIMANILAGPLREMAPAICGAMNSGAALVLSGILDTQADSVESAYASLGLGRAERLADGEWRALIFRAS